jgi:hypothetical protein
MKIAPPVRHRVVGWLFGFAGLFLIADESRQGLRLLVFFDDSVFLGWLPELALSAALTFTIAWFATSSMARIALAAVVVSLVLHAITGVFVRDVGVVDVLFVIIHSVSLVGCLVSGVLALQRGLFSSETNVVFALVMFLLALVGLVDLTSIIYSSLHGYPFGWLEPADDLFHVPDLLKSWLFVVIELLAGFLQIVTGVLVAREVRLSPPAASLSL